MHLICFRSCELFFRIFEAIPNHDPPPTSADLEITVQLLVQIDKLVQLIESPVFTCECTSASRF